MNHPMPAFMFRAIFTGATVLLVGCVSTPQIEDVIGRIEQVRWNGVDMAFDVTMNNPMPVSLRAPKGEYAIDIAGTKFVRESAVPAFDLPAQSRNTVTLPARFEYHQVYKLVRGWKGKGSLPITLRGTIDVIVAGAAIGIPFEYEDELPVVQRPKIDLAGMRLGEVSLSGASLLLDAKLENPNDFAIGLADLGYDIRAGGTSIGKIVADSGGSVGPGSTGNLELRAQIASVAAARQLVASRLQEFKVDLTGAINTPYGPLSLAD
jgi:LEA14-like dessication related protein